MIVLLNQIEAFLNNQPELVVRRIDESILQVQSEKASSPRFIDLSFETEPRIGISMVVDYFPNATSLDTAWKFLDLLSSPIERKEYFKGKARYKVDYRVIKETGFKELFGTGMTWLYPFWKKDTTHVVTEKEFISRANALKEFKSLKSNF
ncbi:hypothetical protein TH61_09125 [Rufibacter sp. DG15C]|uniref:hypothetical protein n=1 Tax=Rufibacter sp. DG15C TaxID=1379909 RepID=UPI00078E8E72|nr:hypothetical protein [Rufibacter sp. DG15C]AMM51298.1 hypothetical protein TH61_09125 [Rufibacter sp. DG15C]